MTINTHLPTDTAAANLRDARAAAGTAPRNAAPSPAASPGLSEGLSIADEDGDTAIQDGAQADHALDFIRSTLPGQRSLALSAQAGQNPETVLGLLQ